VIALPGCMLARRLGEKRTCLVGLTLMVLGGCLAGDAGSFAGIASGRAVSGAGAVIFNLVLTSMVAGWFAGAEIVTAMAVLITSWPAAIAAALLGETALSVRYGWSTVAYSVAALCLAAWAAVALLYSPHGSGQSGGQAPDRSAFSWPEMAACGFAGLLWGAFNAGLVVFYSFTPQFLAQRGLPPLEASSVTSLGLWMSIVSLPLGGWVVEALRRPNAGIVGSCVATAMVLAALPIMPWPMTLGLGLGLAIGPGAGAIVGLPARMVSPGNRAIGLGIFYTGYYVMMAIGPGLAGWAQKSGSTAGVSLFVGSALFLAGVPLLAAANASSKRQVARIALY
jgi:predicted MFS family arabinose efflux permease